MDSKVAKGNNNNGKNRISTWKEGVGNMWILFVFDPGGVDDILGLLQWRDSAFKVLFGQDPPLLKRKTILSKVEEEVNRLTQQWDELLDYLKQHLLKAGDRMRKQDNKYRRSEEYAVGDWGFLNLQPNKMCSLARKPNQKLSPLFYCPFRFCKE